MVNAKIPRKPCINCGKEPSGHTYKYCSNFCQHEFEYLKYVERWKQGKEHGLQKLGIVSSHVKKYLRRKYGNKCCLCAWSRVNPKTGIVPLVADHIDSNWRNNDESNLRLLCPNCDSLTSTFAALNRGNGRTHRVLSKRAHEARKFVTSKRKIRVLPYNV